jgi:two-component system, NarL family, sensor kinase
MQEKLSEVVIILVGSTLTTLTLTTLVVIAVIIGQRRKFRHRKELLEMKSNYDKEVLRTQLETQAQTLETISQELHDNVGTLISIAMVQLNSPQHDAQQADEPTRLLDEAMDILRDISRSINPENIKKRGLAQSIHFELERIRKSRQYAIHYKTEGDEFEIDPQHQVIIFRIVQESLNNILKHAQASEINVTLQFHLPGLSITLQDNGRGFFYQPELGASTNHSGLGNMMKRARLIGGLLSIHSEPDKGTILLLNYPGLPSETELKYHKYGMHTASQKDLPSRYESD